MPSFFKESKLHCNMEDERQRVTCLLSRMAQVQSSSWFDMSTSGISARLQSSPGSYYHHHTFHEPHDKRIAPSKYRQRNVNIARS